METQAGLSEQQQAAVERIRKILSKVNHEGGATQASEGEMNIALEMAKKLMAKFNLEDTDLSSGTEQGRNNAFDSMKEERAYWRSEIKQYPFFSHMASAVSFVTEAGVRIDY